MYTICLSENAKQELLCKKEKEVLRINNTIEDLIKGLWKGGTRVKKLHSINKKRCIYEARVDKSQRMLFSVQKSEVNIVPHIFIYNIAVEHDKVIRAAQSILGEDYSEINYIYDEKNSKSETIESLINDEKVYYPEQNQIFNIIDDSRFYELTDDDLLRILYKDNLIEEDLIEFKLRLSQEQKELINKPLPMLIAGTAGSGKTTVIIYKMLCDPSMPKLYLTYNEKLCKEAEVLFRHLVRGMDNEEDYIKNTHFHTFQDLLDKFYGNTVKTIMTKERFISEYLKYSRGNQLDKKFPPLMVWEEIRGVWKSRNNDECISLEQYQNISEDEAPNFINCRKDAYRIYQWYDNFLKVNFIEDDLDLLRGFLNSKENLNLNYSMIVCDEVQDLTRLHLLFLFKLARNIPERLLIAGDDHQIINHSGFRWESVKNLFYNELNKTRIELYKLNKNFRCSGNIANLAGSINELQQDFIDVSYKVKTLKEKSTGDKPTLFYKIDEKDVLKYICNLGPTQAVVVKDRDQQKELYNFFLSEYKKSPLIFTIEEAKGLEFELVILWKLVNDSFNSSGEWDKIKRRSDLGLDTKQKKFIRYEASLLYVAITRAIKHCLIYDGANPSVLWTFSKIRENINFDPSLIKLQNTCQKVFSASDWFTQGKKLLNEELYQQALECFNRVNDKELNLETDKLKKMTQAKILINNGELKEAGNIYIQLSMIEEAEYCFDSGSYYDVLFELFGTQKYGYKNLEKSYTYSIKKFDSEKEWRKSALFCKLNKRFEDAAIRFKRAEDYKDAAFIYENNLNKYIEALELYIEICDTRATERCIGKLKNYYLKYEEIINNEKEEFFNTFDSEYAIFYPKNFFSLWRKNIGKLIIHKKFGEGKIANIEEDLITIDFGSSHKCFIIDTVEKVFLNINFQEMNSNLQFFDNKLEEMKSKIEYFETKLIEMKSIKELEAMESITELDEFWKYHIESIKKAPNDYFVYRNNLYSKRYDYSEVSNENKKYNVLTLGGRNIQNINATHLGKLTYELEYEIKKTLGQLICNE